MLVSDALDAVVAEARLQQGGALQRLAGGHLGGRELLLEVVAAADGAGRTGGERHPREDVAGRHHRLQDLHHGGSGDGVVPQVVAQLVELVEDHHILARGA